MAQDEAGRRAFRKVKTVEDVSHVEVDGSLVVTIVTRGRPTDFLVEPLQSYIGGHAYRLIKLGGDGARYNVLLNDTDSHCDCRGFSMTDGCRHLQALEDLTGAGVLPFGGG